MAVEVGGALQLRGHVHHGPRPRVRVLEVRAPQTWHGMVHAVIVDVIVTFVCEADLKILMLSVRSSVCEHEHVEMT